LAGCLPVAPRQLNGEPVSHQDGYIWKKGHAWYGRWYEDIIVDDEVLRQAKARKLAPVNDRYRNKSDVQPLLDELLKPINEGRAKPEGSMTVARYYENLFLPYVKTELKPSTVNGYRQTWRMYLSEFLQSTSMRDFRCVDSTKLLNDIYEKHQIGRMTLRHCKALLSSIFTHAKRNGVIDGMNPVIDAGIPRKAHRSKPTQAATAEQVTLMLHTLTGVSRMAVALVYFCGLRPGEARGAQWRDYDGEKLMVRRSVWRTHSTDTKTEHGGTEEKAAPVPVCEPLRRILDAQRKTTGYILEGPRKKPLNLNNLAKRVIRPALAKKNIPWAGWYTLRRGIGTLATAIDSDLAAKGWLRHSNIATTRQFYIKDLPLETQRAAKRVGELFTVDGVAQ
jgi:integrase